jgi:hypothetical protein
MPADNELDEEDEPFVETSTPPVWRLWLLE